MKGRPRIEGALGIPAHLEGAGPLPIQSAYMDALVCTLTLMPLDHAGPYRRSVLRLLASMMTGKAQTSRRHARHRSRGCERWRRIDHCFMLSADAFQEATQSSAWRGSTTRVDSQNITRHCSLLIVSRGARSHML